MSLQLSNRKDYDPLDPEGVYVLCEKLIIEGFVYRYGVRIPDFVCHPAMIHEHYNSGVLGTKDELESLLGPIKLAEGYEDPCRPYAEFVMYPAGKSKPPLEEKEERGEFAIENAELLSTKKDLQGYAAQFDIELKVASNISMKKMREQLAEIAEQRGLI